MTERWTRRPEGSNWGDFGPDDERGRMNLVTDERVLAAVREVQVGKRFCLSLPLDLPGGRLLNARRFPPRRFATDRAGRANFNFPLAELDPRLTDVVCDDAVLLCLQYSTQWDSLAHVGSRFDADGDGEPETVYYNGWRGGREVLDPHHHPERDEFTRHEGNEARRLGIHNMAETGVQGRGVMIDLHAHFGRARQRVGYAELERVMRADGVVVEPGDMVCLHTGFAQAIVEMGGDPDPAVLEGSCPVLDGSDPELQAWVRDSGLAVLIADNYAVEEVPNGPPADARCGASMPLHELCLFKLGVHLGELWHLTPLAEWLRANGRYRFLLTAPPLRLPGAVGSPATPVATV
ncbi:MAG: cyclase family protein [Ectothiorhodospiraceae bacterium]|nr:cyclase family protein [Ectothiorhodospiraceae bacterium]